MSIRNLLRGLGLCLTLTAAFASGGGARADAVVFDRNFRTEEGDPSLDGFDVIKQYDGVGKDAIRFARGYGIAFPLRGNIHLVRMPAQHACAVDCAMFLDPAFADPVKFDVYYRYDATTRVGGVLSIELDREAGQATIRSGTVRKLSYDWTDEVWTTTVGACRDDGTFEWHLKLDEDVVRFGSASFAVPDGVPSAGRIGLDKFWPAAPLVISRLSVAGEAAAAHEAFPKREWRFPRTALASMSDWRFVFAATNSGPQTVLNAAVEGGPAEAFNRRIGYTRHLPNEALDRPWFAVVRPDGTVEPRHYLFFGRIGYREHWCPKLPYMGKADVECPVRRTFHLVALPAGCRLLIGFDGFESEDRRYMGNLRKMMLVDPASGARIAVGDALDANGLAVEVDSGREKRICGLIPKSTSGYAEALDYAEQNHFFLENEAAKLKVRVRQAAGRYAPESLRVDCTLQDAFKDEVRPLKATSVSGASPFPGEDGLSVEVEPLTLPVGVYHLALAIRCGEETLLRKSIAFEVMGEGADAPRPQLASGLPEMMSPICDYQSESNESDYRGMGGNDQTHYFAINGMQVLPTVERGDWNLNKLYRRKYFGWFSHRLVPGQSPEAFEERFRDIDYLCTGLLSKPRIPVCSVEAYAGELREVLSDFLRGRCDGSSGLSRLAADASVPMTLPLLKELLERHGQAWLERAAEWTAAKSTAEIGRWKGVRELAHYFTVPYYTYRCKGAFFAKTFGIDALRHPERIWYTGFAILEDYPFLVGASPLEGLHALAALKMDAPELSLAPEVKGMCAIPMDLSTVYGCPPYGVMNEEDATFKRFIDFKYTACWYRDGRFRYWTDDRILLCNPSPEETDNVLRAWREVRRHSPVRPVRTYAIVTGSACCSRHPLKALVSDDDGKGFLDVVNTVEEFPFWAALAARGNGLPNGFLVRPKEIAKLTPDDVHTLILPPMDALTDEERSAVRKLHARGVNLVASENAEGMEDVFGVRRLSTSRTVESIGGELSLTGEAAAAYDVVDAETLLSDDAGTALLAFKTNGCASAAFYTLAPTLFSRAYLHEFPMQSGVVLSRSAAELFRRMLPSPEMSLSGGRLTVCRDRTGGLEFCVMEDAQPRPSHEIFPVLTLCGDYAKARFESSKPCTVIRNDGRCLQVRFALAPRECVTLHVAFAAETFTDASERFLEAARAAYGTPDYADYTNTLVDTYLQGGGDVRSDNPVAGGRIGWKAVGGMYNVRDIGGWNGLRPGRAFRGGEPDCRDRAWMEAKGKSYHGIDITEDGMKYMRETLGVKTDLDLRAPHECPHPEYSALGMDVKLLRGMSASYMSAYTATNAIARTLRYFADDANYPIYFHCWGGADRTGLLAFLLEGLCGANETDIAIDYELTSFARKFGTRLRSVNLNGTPGFAAMMKRMKEYPGATLGDKFAYYAEKVCGLTADEVAAIRRNLSEPRFSNDKEVKK